ncbi:MAG: LCP family protein [Mogibacterium sp.]|nr:LCP family protein [Mogibacterium sp.]
MAQTTNKKNRKPSIFFPSLVIYKILVIVMLLVAIGFLAMMTVVKALPSNITMPLVGIMVAMLIIASILLARRNRFMRFLGIIVAAAFIAVYGLGIHYLTSTYAMFSNIASESSGVSPQSGKDVTQEAFNVYISGIDQWTVERGYDLERSDVNMIVTVCPSTRKVLLTSIPRDAYVPLHRTGTMDKLTHTGIYGIDETLNSVEDWIHIPMDYYVKVNFNACVHIVDAIGGIDVKSPKKFKSKISRYRYKKGWNHLNGKQALYYARERKAFKGEDQLRVKNQQQVMEAVLKKMMSSSTLLTSYGEIMKTLGDEMETNMPQSDIEALIRMQLSDLGVWDIQSQRMSGEYEMEIVASMDPSNKYQVLKVDPKVFDECLEGIDKVMNPTEEEIQATIENKKKANLMNFINSLRGKTSKDDSEESEEGEAAGEEAAN